MAEALGWIVDWHKRLDAGENARALTLGQIERYAALAGTYN